MTIAETDVDAYDIADAFTAPRGPWRILAEVLKTSRGLRYDGCHKIYVLMDISDIQAEIDGYGIGAKDAERLLQAGDVEPVVVMAGREGDELRPWISAGGSPAWNMDMVVTGWESSCEGRFVQVVTDGEIVGVIEQFSDPQPPTRL